MVFGCWLQFQLSSKWITGRVPSLSLATGLLSSVWILCVRWIGAISALLQVKSWWIWLLVAISVLPSEFLARAESCSASVLLVFSTAAFHYNPLHHQTTPSPPAASAFLFVFFKISLFRLFVVFSRIFTFPRPSCSSSIASSFTMFSCFTFSSTWKCKDQQGCYLRSVHMWLLFKLTSNSLIWTSCGLMCDSWLNVFTCNANLISQSTLSANNAKFKCED